MRGKRRRQFCKLPKNPLAAADANGDVRCSRCGRAYPAQRVVHPCRFPCHKGRVMRPWVAVCLSCAKNRERLNRVKLFGRSLHLGDAAAMVADPIAKGMGLKASHPDDA